MEQIAKQLLKRISDKAENLTDYKITKVSHSENNQEWRAYISQSNPYWEDISWRVKEPNKKGDSEVHLGFYSEIPSDQLTNAIKKTEKLGERIVDQIIKNDNGIRLVWKVNLNDNSALEKVEFAILKLLPEFLNNSFETLIKTQKTNENKMNFEVWDSNLINGKPIFTNGCDGICGLHLGVKTSAFIPVSNFEEIINFFNEIFSDSDVNHLFSFEWEGDKIVLCANTYILYFGETLQIDWYSYEENELNNVLSSIGFNDSMKNFLKNNGEEGQLTVGYIIETLLIEKNQTVSVENIDTTYGNSSYEIVV